MSDVTVFDKSKELVYGVREEAIKEVFGADTFGLSPVGSDRYEILSGSTCGVARGYLPKFANVAPLVTYGVTVKQLPARNAFGSDLFCKEELVPALAVYKQRKTDKDGKDYYVLSFGVSGEVLLCDVRGYSEVDPILKESYHTNMICLQTSLSVAALRHYNRLVEICHYGAPFDDVAFHKNFSAHFEFLRDGKRKPDYDGAAHLAAVYVVPVAPDAFTGFHNPDYEMMGWLTQEDLRNVAMAQQAMENTRSDDPSVRWGGFADEQMQNRLEIIATFTMEPWSRMLAIDENGDFASMLRNSVYHQQL